MANPGSISTAPLCWLKADAITGHVDGDSIALWADSSASANNAAGAAGSQPVYKTNVAGGLPVLRFGGSQFFSLPTGFANFTAGLAVFIVVNPSATVNFEMLLQLSGASNTNYLILQRDGSSNAFYYGVVSSSGSYVRSSPLNNNKFQIIEAAHGAGAAGSSQTASLYTTGVLGASSAVTVAGNTSRNSNFIGHDTFGDGDFVGDIAEVVIFNAALSTADRQSVENYLSAKYGLAIPAAPTQLAGISGSGKVTLSCTAPAGTGITFNVYDGTSVGAEGGVAVLTGQTDPANLVVTGLTNGQKYFFFVTAQSAAGESPHSNETGIIPAASSGSRRASDSFF